MTRIILGILRRAAEPLTSRDIALQHYLDSLRTIRAEQFVELRGQRAPHGILAEHDASDADDDKQKGTEREDGIVGESRAQPRAAVARQLVYALIRTSTSLRW